MSEKIIVTGGTGYIGSHTIIELFRNTDYDVICIDNQSRSYLSTLDRIKDITGKTVINYSLDLRDYDALKKVFETHHDIVGIIHFAAFKTVPESVAEPLLYYDNNFNSLINVMRACQDYQIKNLIFSSSCSLYGNVSSLPVAEDTPLSKTESPYAHTKLVGEEMLQNFVKAVTSTNVIALRYFNPVGADMTGRNGELPIRKPNNLVPVITQVASGILPQLTIFGSDYETRDGTCIRDYIHVSDIANAHILALDYLVEQRNKDTYEVFNLGTGNGVTTLEAVKAFEKVAHLDLNYTIGERRPGDVAAIYSNSEKAEKILGWKCKYDIEDMMASAWKWQQYLNENKIEK